MNKKLLTLAIGCLVAFFACQKQDGEKAALKEAIKKIEEMTAEAKREVLDSVNPAIARLDSARKGAEAAIKEFEETPNKAILNEANQSAALEQAINEAKATKERLESLEELIANQEGIEVFQEFLQEAKEEGANQEEVAALQKAFQEGRVAIQAAFQEGVAKLQTAINAAEEQAKALEEARRKAGGAA
ncbi:MAG: hypothetical protein MI674_05475 [Cytophagales bacterium]|nr:hypothetical protein [Cytophagales bacterium]